MLSTIQRDIEAVYRLDRAFDISEFTVARSQVDAPLDRPEQVLVHESEDVLELALVLDDELLGPNVDWDLERFCVCAEGVSHMLYLAQAARCDSQISQLELEVQAEIDKFALLLLRVGMPAKTAIRRLFLDNRLRTDLTSNERQRYTEANALALAFARSLISRFVTRSYTDGLLAELRRVYRMVGAQKRAYLSGYRP